MPAYSYQQDVMSPTRSTIAQQVAKSCTNIVSPRTLQEDAAKLRSSGFVSPLLSPRIPGREVQLVEPSAKESYLAFEDQLLRRNFDERHRKAKDEKRGAIASTRKKLAKILTFKVNTKKKDSRVMPS